MVIEYAPLEDELGDVLDKAMRRAGLSEQALAERADVAVEKLQEVFDYRGDLSSPEISRLAEVLSLNQPGLLALAQGRYPLPEISGLPFCLYPLRMTHGIGVANAYIVSECGSGTGLLFDTGPEAAQLRRVWPKHVKTVEAVFVTHAETEHIGGLESLRGDYGGVAVFGPGRSGDGAAPGTALGEGGTLIFGGIEVRVLRTPGHSEAHNCYYVSVPKLPGAPGLLISGDLLFAGSIGGAYFCERRLTESVLRLMADMPESTVVAPGHGPLTTIKNERMFNPFVV